MKCSRVPPIRPLVAWQEVYRWKLRAYLLAVLFVITLLAFFLKR